MSLFNRGKVDNESENLRDVSFSNSEVEILREFVNREVENIKVFGPAEESYEKDIENLEKKLA